MNEIKEIIVIICLTVMALGFMYFMYKIVTADN
jgi:hypothetical protein